MGTTVMRCRSGWLVGVLVVTLIGLVGCANESPAPGRSRLPPRPAELRLDGIDPCALLTGEQTRQLGVHGGEREQNTDELGSTDCQWLNDPLEPSIFGYLARLILKRGADSGLDSSTGAQVVTLDGFSAVQATSPHVDPREHCVLLVDVAQGESLWVQWMTSTHGQPGFTHEMACEKARVAGQLMLTNLRELSH